MSRLLSGLPKVAVRTPLLALLLPVSVIPILIAVLDGSMSLTAEYQARLEAHARSEAKSLALLTARSLDGQGSLEGALAELAGANSSVRALRLLAPSNQILASSSAREAGTVARSASGGEVLLVETEPDLRGQRVQVLWDLRRDRWEAGRMVAAGNWHVLLALGVQVLALGVVLYLLLLRPLRNLRNGLECLPGPSFPRQAAVGQYCLEMSEFSKQIEALLALNSIRAERRSKFYSYCSLATLQLGSTATLERGLHLLNEQFSERTKLTIFGREGGRYRTLAATGWERAGGLREFYGEFKSWRNLRSMPTALIKWLESEHCAYANVFSIRSPNGKEWGFLLAARSKRAFLEEEKKHLTLFCSVLAGVFEHEGLSEELKASQERFEELTENCCVMVFKPSPLRPLFISNHIQKLLGLSAQQAMSEDWPARLHVDDRARIGSALTQGLATGDRFVLDNVRLRHQDGFFRSLRIYFQPLLEGGEPIRYQAFAFEELSSLEPARVLVSHTKLS